MSAPTEPVAVKPPPDIAGLKRRLAHFCDLEATGFKHSNLKVELTNALDLVEELSNLGDDLPLEIFEAIPPTRRQWVLIAWLMPMVRAFQASIKAPERMKR